MDSQSQISDWEVTSIDRWKQPTGVAKSVTASMNNFLESVDSISNRSQTVDELQKDHDHRSETPRYSSKHFVDRDLITASETESDSNKYLGDIKVEKNIRIEKKAANDQGNTNVINIDKSSPTTSDDADTSPKFENEGINDTAASKTDNQTVTDLSDKDGSVVC